MALPRRNSGSRFTLAILLLSSVTLISLDARGYEPLTNLRKAATAIVQPFRNIASTIFDPIGDAWESLSNGDTLEKENALLRAQLGELLEYRSTTEGAVEELAALRTQLELKNLGGQETVVAEVTAQSVSNFDPYILEIGKGTQNGIREGMAVISVGGLIGRIEDPGLRSARVRLVTDPNVNVGALVVGTNQVGIITGNGVGQPLRVSDGIPVSADVEIGSVLVTSGSERSPYPGGFAIGTVLEIIVDEINLEKELVVAPTGQIENLEFVTVIIYEPVNSQNERSG
ncbi:MAG: rod shape-determining protein MreC [Acidimicrobiaceae bacterium]|nr:rod shape-determining protein MreC [Acidimicrobiaceae bacterium]MBA4809774.1 rod shape-determining protein MreC [Acidimicrobiales bacterium]OUV00479.1 MAG: rod shape-determining protein MreC [Acidimicrobiaceae bacterium TMED77]|tara:strand:- start:7117 stop:7974 length:858 start_codon:yes stop_codon:yes gene_type:complete